MHSVGDIIWVIGNNRPGVRPYQIVEETTHKTLQGTVTTYSVRFPGPSDETTSIDLLDGEIFTDVNTVRDELNSRAADAINRMISAGEDLVSEWFQSESVPEENVEDKENQDAESSNDISPGEQDYLVLPDGTRAKINIKGDIP